MENMAPPSLDGVNSGVVSMSAKIMVAAVIVLFFVVAVCFFLSFYAKWYWSITEDPATVSWRRRAARQRQPAAVRAHRRGLEPDALGTLPIVVYDPKDFKEGLECAVCLSEVSEGEKARLLPKCNHGFHVECIDMWFKSHSTCPLCRSPVVSDNNNDNVDQLQGTHENSISSDSDSNSDSDNDDHSSYASAVHSVEVPTNVLFWGNETQVSSHGDATNAASTSGVRECQLVIDIPRELYEDCLSSPPLGTRLGEEEAKTPSVSRLKSLKRLLSRGKRVSPSTHGSSSADVLPV